ncbi:MAG: FecR family protein [Sphingobacteriaceae bacterium]
MSRLEYLFNAYINHTDTEEEKGELMILLLEKENEAMFRAFIDQIIENGVEEMKMNDQIADRMLKKIFKKDELDIYFDKNKSVTFPKWIRMAAAAILFLSIGVLFWVVNKSDDINQVMVTKKQSAIMPGGNRALLTISNGSTIVLDSVKNGKLTQLGNMNINKKNGLLIYASPPAYGVQVEYSLLSTPRGGQYQVILPDGTKVWLNASSSLRFPSAFTDSCREVTLKGEAYFEVSTNREKPFAVNVNGMQIMVLGTHFNVNAYTDENEIRTSLLEGSIKITKGNASGVLKPGQQAILDKREDNLVIRDADINEAVAWKNGIFQFDGADISTIMRQISRWFDVEVIYAGEIPKRRFQGKISRNAQLTEVLKILELSDVKFAVQGKKIIVE